MKRIQNLIFGCTAIAIIAAGCATPASLREQELKQIKSTLPKANVSNLEYLDVSEILGEVYAEVGPVDQDIGLSFNFKGKECLLIQTTSYRKGSAALTCFDPS